MYKRHSQTNDDWHRSANLKIPSELRKNFRNPTPNPKIFEISPSGWCHGLSGHVIFRARTSFSDEKFHVLWTVQTEPQCDIFSQNFWILLCSTTTQPTSSTENSYRWNFAWIFTRQIQQLKILETRPVSSEFFVLKTRETPKNPTCSAHNFGWATSSKQPPYKQLKRAWKRSEQGPTLLFCLVFGTS